MQEKIHRTCLSGLKIRFYLTKMLETGFLEKNNTTGTDPANIRLDEDLSKTFFVFVFRRRLQDALTKTNIFALLIRFQETSSRRLAKMSSRCLQDVFKTSSRRLGEDQCIRLGHTSSRRLQNVLQEHLQDIFKTFSRRTIKLKCSW